jgi:hypothetical protein
MPSSYGPGCRISPTSGGEKKIGEQGVGPHIATVVVPADEDLVDRSPQNEAAHTLECEDHAVPERPGDEGFARRVAVRAIEQFLGKDRDVQDVRAHADLVCVQLLTRGS